MSTICKILLILLLFLVIVNNSPPSFLPSNKYVRTGVFAITTGISTLPNVLNTFPITFSNCMTSPSYKIGFGIFSLDIKFSNVKIQFDIQTSFTSNAGFEVVFSSIMGNLISFLKICYIIKQPSYSDIFYIENYRFTGMFILSYNVNIFTQQYAITPSLPIGSLPTMKERTFLHSFDLESTVIGLNNNIDVYPSCSFISQSILELKVQTLYDNVVIRSFAVTIVFYEQSQINSAGLSQFTLAYTQSNVMDTNLFYISTPLKMLDYNTYVGIKGFHVRTGQTPNFLNFQTTFISDTHVTFPSANSINWKYMKFQILIAYAKSCPSTQPYHLLYMNDCVTNIVPGYTKLCDNTLVADLQVNLQYVLKHPESNQVEMIFSLEPNDPSFNNLYTQIDWSNLMNLNLPNSNQSTELIIYPYPYIKIIVDYNQDLQELEWQFVMPAYDPLIYPINFKGLKLKTKTVKLTSANNLAIKYYDSQTYKMANILMFITIILSALYLILFLIGFIAGKLYVLEMALVPQVTFMSLACLDNVSPTMASLSFLKYVFGYSYSWSPDNFPSKNQTQNYLNMIGIFQYFIFNYNIMFILTILSLIIFLALYLRLKARNQSGNQSNVQKNYTQSSKIKRFFSLDTPLYLTLWFGLWIIFGGEFQMLSLVNSSKDQVLSYMGLGFFFINFLIFCVYFFIYLKKHQKIASFYRYFSDFQTKKTDQGKSHYFYLIFFIERLMIGSILANLMKMQFIHCVILGISLVLILLIAIFKPYTTLIQRQRQKAQNSPLIRPNIRQILNYTILSIIQILFFVTNQIQSSSFVLYIPIVIICMLFLNIILTVCFLIIDGALKQDIKEFKRTFGLDKSHKYILQTEDYQEKKDGNQIEIGMLQNSKSIYEKNKSGQKDNSHTNQNYHLKDSQQNETKTQFKQQNVESQPNKNKKSPNKQSDLSIEQAFQSQTQKKYQLQRRNFQNSKNSALPSQIEESFYSRHRQIMKHSHHKIQKQNLSLNAIFYSYLNNNNSNDFPLRTPEQKLK